MLRSIVHRAPRRAGAGPSQGTSLADEGFEMLDAKELISSFSRHLMVHLDRWQEKGFAPVGADYLARLLPERGTRRGIDGNGDLLIHRAGARGTAERRPLIDALGQCAWRDPESGEPWL